MLFNSLQFAVFFPFVVLLYFTLQQRQRVPMLLVASCAFYMAFIPAYILILFVTIGIDYVAGIYLERCQGTPRKALLVLSVLSTCAVLFVFKYYDFFLSNFVGIANLAGCGLSKPVLHIILPIGLSFHTFQSLSYVIEVYQGRYKAEKNLLVYATYVMFFPQLVAGPIERPQGLIHQFYETHHFDYSLVTRGLKRIAWGLFKKVVVADRLALYVNDVYAAPRDFNGLQLSIATFFFAYQIYCDFSGYTDIAIGSAQILGFKLRENFDTPYYSRSISEFWHRWHMSLSTWFRDYLYIPLGGSRVNTIRWCANILITFGVSGLWHGANWTYVLWGLLNGFYLLVGTASQGARRRIYDFIGLPEADMLRRGIGILVTFLLTLIAWVIFRAKSMGDAWYILTHCLSNWDFHSIKTTQFHLKHFPAAVGAIVVLEVVQCLRPRLPTSWGLSGMPVVVRWAAYMACVFGILLFGVYHQTQFIYFQF